MTGLPASPIEPEFGHIAWALPRGRVDGWGVGPFVISVGKRSWRFEDSDRFGPSLVNKSGEILGNPWPPERSPFWRAHRIWKRQGRRVADDGMTCMWDEPAPTTFFRISRRHSIIVENGDEDGAMIQISRPVAATLSQETS